jgi:hypothetical protein
MNDAKRRLREYVDLSTAWTLLQGHTEGVAHRRAKLHEQIDNRSDGWCQDILASLARRPKPILQK